jgi:hypothetical protein
MASGRSGSEGLDAIAPEQLLRPRATNKKTDVVKYPEGIQPRRLTSRLAFWHNRRIVRLNYTAEAAAPRRFGLLV